MTAEQHIAGVMKIVQDNAVMVQERFVRRKHLEWLIKQVEEAKHDPQKWAELKAQLAYIRLSQ